MRLSEMQGAFLGWLASGEDAAMRRLPLAKGAEHGLGVYQNNYRAALMACLADSFPQTLLWLGEGPFEAAAARHIERVPPDSWTLDDYASGFPASLAEDYPYDPEVAELARIELVLSQVFVAADAVPLDAGAMGAIDWDSARLQTVPALSILSLHSNAEEIWIALADETPPPEVGWGKEARPVLIWRQGFMCRLRSLDADEAGMLGYLSGDAIPFTDLCRDAAARWGEHSGIARIGQYLARWVADGLVR
ncbi:DNA-binding domain-containing protein [Novosphingobium sediminicola]|uniref:Putative DNA-binding domain-containing protein n=1 Tax=Novosphingobium sediminicola TaxID=563162 RepID=A0A7W6CIL5_9SPHN|nr:DNA-binding domain-containing protein [Novosphingobium sediminicola]MBB3957226.1 hypothetical protein [Novosphingobium sediminicola]